ncbi:MAG: hypothetical protein HY465_04085 [Deltaproteobacteria bacterium]|nr:hypothetical protein [Deltaproteobacteria bacterium]
MFVPHLLFSQDFDTAKTYLKQGASEVAAQSFVSFAFSNPKNKKAPEALAMAARILDKLQDAITERYEKQCYWAKGAPRTPACMEAGARELNTHFGEGAFHYIGGTEIAFLEYTGSHYRHIAEHYAKSDFADEADFYLLLHNLKQHPDIVLPMIQAFLKRHSKGEWHRRGLLLWARVNEDVHFIWKKWSWVVYNGVISDDELIIKAEPYRREAVAAFEKVIKTGKGSFEGKAAQRDLAQFRLNGTDGTIYSITNDSSPGTWEVWGIQ